MWESGSWSITELMNKMWRGVEVAILDICYTHWQSRPTHIGSDRTHWAYSSNIPLIQALSKVVNNCPLYSQTKFWNVPSREMCPRERDLIWDGQLILLDHCHPLLELISMQPSSQTLLLDSCWLFPPEMLIPIM